MRDSDFGALASAYGMRPVVIDAQTDVETVIAAIASRQEPTIIEVATDASWSAVRTVEAMGDPLIVRSP